VTPLIRALPVAEAAKRLADLGAIWVQAIVV
jgi:hypothetical protein